MRLLQPPVEATMRLAFAILLMLTGQSIADEIKIQGDRFLLSGSAVTFRAALPLEPPFPPLPSLVYHVDLNTPKPVHAQLPWRFDPSTPFAVLLARFRHHFDGVPAGNYSLNVRLVRSCGRDNPWVIYVIAEKTVQLTVTENLTDFFQMSGRQKIREAPTTSFLIGRPVLFLVVQSVPSSVLRKAALRYSWSLTGPHWNPMTTVGVHGNSTFVHRFTVPGAYTVAVNITANLTTEGATGQMVRRGVIKQIVHVESDL